MHMFNSFPRESLFRSQHRSSDSLMNRNGREVARAVCTPSAGAVCWDHVKHPAFAPGIPESAVALWPFCTLLHNCAACTRTLDLFNLLLEEAFVQLQALQWLVPGLSLSDSKINGGRSHRDIPVWSLEVLFDNITVDLQRVTTRISEWCRWSKSWQNWVYPQHIRASQAGLLSLWKST